jgi:hypothetical protein
MSELPKAQTTRISNTLDENTMKTIITVAMCATVVGVFAFLRSCYVGEDVARAKCITAGGDPYKCCDAFTHGAKACSELAPAEGE